MKPDPPQWPVLATSLPAREKAVSSPALCGSPGLAAWDRADCSPALLVCPLGIPRSYVEAQEDYLRREPKLLKREGTPPPPPPPRDLTEAYKPRPLEALGPLKLKPASEGLVATVKEAGRSIHEIPREELRHTPELPLAPRPLKEGSITQVCTLWSGLRAWGHSKAPGVCDHVGC